MKYRLLAPGPTPVPDRVLSVMARSVYHHRTPAFERIFEGCRQGLQWLFQTNHEVLTLSCSGTGAFEAIFQNFFSPGDTIINVGGGKFGDRWAQMATIFGLEVVSLSVPWGESIDPGLVQQALDNHPSTKAVVCVACETSTGTRQPYEALGKMLKDKADCLLIVDGITALGVWDIQPERDHIDVLVAGSQKALMLPPGLAFMSVSPKAWKANQDSRMPHYYFDLAKERATQAKNQTAYTPAVSLITGLQESLLMMQEEGLPNLFARHARIAKATRTAIKALNLELFSKSPADSVTAVKAPTNIPENSIYAGLRDRANLTIAGGQEQLKGKIFRIAHLGYFDELDILTVLSALEIILRQEGYTNFEPGASVAAASPILEEGFQSSST
ncbi:MAG: alanine--glyoxylate aminotransferase family protein [Deltaproteobacteria bacterium]|nr:alanine--glyoxylate aminotransferase family protein [Deltaproteobacteria bacterium]